MTRINTVHIRALRKSFINLLPSDPLTPHDLQSVCEGGKRLMRYYSPLLRQESSASAGGKGNAPKVDERR